MLQAAQSRSDPSFRRWAVQFLILFGLLCFPVILPRFSGYRVIWLVFVFLLALVSMVLAIPFTWLEKKMAIATGNWIENSSLRAIAGLGLCSAAAAVFFRLIALHNDIIFLLVAIPALLAVWFALHYWRDLFRLIADKLHWSARTCRVIGLLVMVASLASGHFLGGPLGFFASFVCFLAAIGCFPPRTCRYRAIPSVEK
jgi:hypothetical protein